MTLLDGGLNLHAPTAKPASAHCPVSAVGESTTKVPASLGVAFARAGRGDDARAR
mgnify:CR=1 FL=1